MKLPGFTAELALSEAAAQYRTLRGAAVPPGAVQPQGWACAFCVTFCALCLATPPAWEACLLPCFACVAAWCQ